MKYRKFGKQNWEVSALGFGAMRPPASATDRGIALNGSVHLILFDVPLALLYTMLRLGRSQNIPENV